MCSVRVVGINLGQAAVIHFAPRTQRSWPRRSYCRSTIWIAYPVVISMRICRPLVSWKLAPIGWNGTRIRAAGRNFSLFGTYQQQRRTAYVLRSLRETADLRGAVLQLLRNRRDGWKGGDGVACGHQLPAIAAYSGISICSRGCGWRTAFCGLWKSDG